MNEDKTVKVGDRFETRDKRDEGRVVEVFKPVPTDASVEESRPIRARRNAAAWGAKDEDIEEWLRLRETRFLIRTEAHPKNPDAVGNVSNISAGTLLAKYRKVSR